jgi:hypothetical protein
VTSVDLSSFNYLDYARSNKRKNRIRNSLNIIPSVPKYLHVCRRTDRVMDGSFSLSARRFFKRISKPRDRDLPGKWCTVSVRIRILLVYVWALDFLITKLECWSPNRDGLLKLTPLGYAVPSNDLEMLWNEAALFMLLSLTFFLQRLEKYAKKPYWKIAEISKPQPNRPRHYARNVLRRNPVLCVPWVKYDGRSEDKFTWPVIW